jgi:hypothetical protein
MNNDKTAVASNGIQWARDDCGRTVSVCGRFKIDPKYWGCVRPTSYDLKVDGKHWSTNNLLRDAKASAQDVIRKEQQQIDTHGQ